MQSLDPGLLLVCSKLLISVKIEEQMAENVNSRRDKTRVLGDTTRSRRRLTVEPLQRVRQRRAGTPLAALVLREISKGGTDYKALYGMNASYSAAVPGANSAYRRARPLIPPARPRLSGLNGPLLICAEILQSPLPYTPQKISSHLMHRCCMVFPIPSPFPLTQFDFTGRIAATALPPPF